MKTLDQWLRLLESRHPVEIELGLERISTVAGNLGIGSIAARVVVVAGTNGKGSFVRTLESLALAAGLRVGAYTSPHLVRYNERVRIQGKDVEDHDFCQAFETIYARQGDTPLTYFEVGTLAALLIMAGRSLDLAILEVGLGGRHDAVNIVDADIAVITSIALDHEHWLGNTRETIALEKAGIARAGQPVICADPAPPATLVDYLAQIQAKPLYIGQDFSCQIGDGQELEVQLVADSGGRLGYAHLPKPRLPLPSVIAATQCLQLLGVTLPHAELASVFATLELSGRYQKCRHRGKTIILDVAHNPAAAAYLAEKLRAEPPPVFGVVAIMADKDVRGFASALAHSFAHWFTGNLTDQKRALPSVQFSEIFTGLSLPHTISDTIEQAFDNALSQLPEDGTLVVCGSFFTISAILKHMEMTDDL